MTSQKYLLPPIFQIRRARRHLPDGFNQQLITKLHKAYQFALDPGVRGMSGYGMRPEIGWMPKSLMSAFGGSADLRDEKPVFPLVSQSGLRSPNLHEIAGNTVPP